MVIEICDNPASFSNIPRTFVIDMYFLHKSVEIVIYMSIRESRFYPDCITIKI